MDSYILDKFSLQPLFMISERMGVKVYACIQNGKKVAVKIYSHRKPYMQETDCLVRLYKAGAAVPKILNMGRIRSDFVIIQEWCDGEPLLSKFKQSDIQMKSKLIYSVGELLASFQFALEDKEFGNSIFWHRDDYKDINSYSWKEYIYSQVRKWRQRIKLSCEDESLGLLERLNLLEGRLKLIQEPEKLSIIHADYTMRNIQYNAREDKLIALDFEGALIGDPLYDLARITWVDIAEDLDLQWEFYKGWEDRSGYKINLEILQLYKAIITMSSVAWVDNLPEKTESNKRFRQLALETFIKVSDSFL
ncbi:phosphotransferase family protein [Bacillus thuringiensis]|uniref:phosphotransferase family protein n=1 Tax=Bacillus thuringiensis TaxID=1428 RepID=UPI00119E0091|nr:aminoglycoside phosphotransferase family protein [Bacillus thuringiensis]